MDNINSMKNKKLFQLALNGPVAVLQCPNNAFFFLQIMLLKLLANPLLRIKTFKASTAWSLNVISLPWWCPQHTQAMQAADVKVPEAFWRTVLLYNIVGARNSFAAWWTLLLNTILALPAVNVRLYLNLKSRLGSWTLEPFHLMVLCKRGWKT